MYNTYTSRVHDSTYMDGRAESADGRSSSVVLRDDGDEDDGDEGSIDRS